MKGLSAESRSAERMLGRISEIKECGRRKKGERRQGEGAGQVTVIKQRKVDASSHFLSTMEGCKLCLGLKKGE